MGSAGGGAQGKDKRFDSDRNHLRHAHGFANVDGDDGAVQNVNFFCAVLKITPPKFWCFHATSMATCDYKSSVLELDWRFYPRINLGRKFALRKAASAGESA
jgi:hypothetical protein